MGADLLIFNLFDVNEPLILGLPDVAPEDTIREIKCLTGRAVGINLEPLEPDVESSVETNAEWQFTSGQAATVENARKAIEMGVALPENILEYGKAIRGVRHTYHRMASSS